MSADDCPPGALWDAKSLQCISMVPVADEHIIKDDAGLIVGYTEGAKQGNMYADVLGNWVGPFGIFAGLLAVLLTVGAVYTRAKFAWPRRPPGPKSASLLMGNLPSLAHKSGPYMALVDLARKYGGIVALRLGVVNCVVLSSAEAVAQIKEQAAAFAGRVMLPSTRILSRNGKDLVFSDYNASWKLQRKLAHAALFNKAKVEEQEARMLPHIRRAVATLADKTEADGSVAPMPVFKHMSMNIVSNIVLSRSFEPDTPEFDELVGAVAKIFLNLGAANAADYLPWMAWTSAKSRQPLANMEAAQTVLCNMLMRHVQEHKETLDRTEPRDFVDRLLIARDAAELRESASAGAAAAGGGASKDGGSSSSSSSGMDRAQEFDDEKIVLVLMDMFLAGTDTTSTTLAWLSALLANHPEHQSALHDELNRVVGPRQPTVADLPKLRVLNACVKETWRHRTVVPIIRRTTTRGASVGRYHVPRGTMVLVNVWGLHHDPDLWRNPLEFDPTRFLHLDAATERAQFIPFGDGHRQCTGMNLGVQEVLLAAAHLVHAFDISAGPGARGGKVDTTPVYGQTLQPAPFNAVFKRRRSAGAE